MSTHLNLQPNFGIPGQRYRHPYMPGDSFYDHLVQAHRGLDDAQSQLLQARLLLLLANHIGDLRVLDEALALARQGAVDAQAPQGAVDAQAPQGAENALAPQGAENAQPPQGAENAQPPQGAENAPVPVRQAQEAPCN